jgi:hypothetical protein
LTTLKSAACSNFVPCMHACTCKAYGGGGGIANGGGVLSARQPGTRRPDAVSSGTARFPTNCREFCHLSDEYKKSMLNYLNPVEC